MKYKETCASKPSSIDFKDSNGYSCILSEAGGNDSNHLWLGFLDRGNSPSIYINKENAEQLWKALQYWCCTGKLKRTTHENR